MLNRTILSLAFAGLLVLPASSFAGYKFRVHVNGVTASTAQQPAGATCPGPTWAPVVQPNASIQAYAELLVPFGSSCVSEIRTCTSGVLSGSNTEQTCAVTAQPTATFVDVAGTEVPNYYNLGSIPLGSSSAAYAGYLKNIGTVPVTLSGPVSITGPYASLFASPALPNGLIDCTTGMALEVGDTCEFGLQFTPQAAGVANTPLTATYAGGYVSKAVQGTGIIVECDLPWGGTTQTQVTAYSSATVPYNLTCESELRTCTSGVLSGTFSAPTCEVLTPASCAGPAWAGTVAHNANITAYPSSAVAFGGVCTQEVRTCTDGVLSGTATAQSCEVTPPAGQQLGLRMDGTVGGTTFTDTRGHTITSSNVTIASGGVSGQAAYFPASGGGALSVTNPGTAFVFPGDLTIEAWVYQVNTTGTIQAIYSSNSGGSNYFYLGWDSANGVWSVSHNAAGRTTYGGTSALNTWKHIALVRAGTTMTVYVNGTAVGSRTVAGTLGHTTVPTIGTSSGGNNKFYGYIDEFQVYNGTAKYLGNFTPAASF